jgi:hypothetical protein
MVLHRLPIYKCVLRLFFWWLQDGTRVSPLLFTVTDAIMSLIEGVMIEAFEASEEAAAAAAEQARLAKAIDGTAAKPGAAGPTSGTDASDRWQRELFADVAAAELQASSPMAKHSGVGASAAATHPDGTLPHLPVPSSNTASTGSSLRPAFVGVDADDLALLEAALRSHEARLESQHRRAAAAAAAASAAIPSSPKTSGFGPPSPRLSSTRLALSLTAAEREGSSSSAGGKLPMQSLLSLN